MRPSSPSRRRGGAELAWRFAGPLLAAWLVPAGRAAEAYDFNLVLRTVGQGYQVRRFGASGGNELLNRRRLTQYLDLSVWDIEPDGWKGPGGDRNLLFVDVSLRFDSDFGGFLLNRPRGDDSIAELKQNQIDVLSAALVGRGIGGRVDFELGRQVHYDLADFYAFDGADVLVRLPSPLAARLAAEAFGGSEVRGELPLSAPIYELDGTSPGSRDPRTHPAQSSALAPMAGAAVELAGREDLRARVAYRRTWSATADRAPDDPASGVDEEKAALTATAGLWRAVWASLAIRYDLLLGGFDDEQLALRARLPRGQALTAEYAFLAPTFDGDSIWNVFAAGPTRDLRAGYEVDLTDALAAHVRAFGRLLEGPPAGQAWGCTAGARWRRRSRGLLGGDVYYDDGAGGLRLGANLSGRWAARPQGLDLEGRLTGWQWRADSRPESNHGVVFGVQGGAGLDLVQGMRVHFLAEDNFGTTYRYELRAIALLDVDVTL